MPRARLQTLFGALVVAQAAHSTEEFVGRLWESFPPARFVSGLMSGDLERGFLLANLLIVGFGLWCWLGPVRRGGSAGVLLAWVWVAIEVINGIVHPLWSLWQGAYVPGVWTAPVLLVCALLLARELRHTGRPAPSLTA